jgi:DNA/RNA endonuclease YhcR with UshA esterase domain
MTRMYFRSVGLALAALFAAGCSESTGPAGTPTDLTVQVYVDANGNGAFNPGDVPVVGATVTATGEDGAAATAQTDATGAAFFPGLAPGTYALSLAGNVPPGAVLASATQPLFTATSLGGAATAEFRYAYFPGSVSGMLYRDENGNGTFEAATDYPAPGIGVQLFAGTTASGTPVATTTTSAAGAFSFAGVRPGTYTVRFDVPAGVNVVGGVDQQVIVPANTQATLQARFTGNLVVPVAQAKARPVGSSVTVEGVVTTTLGEFTSTGATPIGNLYVQDASGGIQVFGIPVSQGLVPGDSVRITGTLGTFSGEVQITTPGLTVTELGTGTVPAPRLLTGAQFASRAGEGSLVRVNELTVTSVGSQTTTSSSFNVGVTAPDGTTFTVRVEGRTDLERTAFTVGQTYNITGISAAFTSGGVTVAQLKPRSTADVVRVSPLTIVEAKALPLGTEVITRGVVTAAPGTFSSAYMYIQDRTGGLLVQRFFRSTAVQPGDSVQVSGAIRNPFGEFQLDTVTRADSVVVTVLGAGTVPAPRVVTGAELLARTYESELARINDVVVTAVGSQSNTGSGFNVTATAPDGSVITIRADGPTNVERPAFTVGQTYDIVGILTVFGGNAQIKPRSTDDVIAS